VFVASRLKKKEALVYAPTMNHFDLLSDDIVLLIMRDYLRPRTLGALTCTCRRFGLLGASDVAWCPHYMRARKNGIVRKLVYVRELPFPRIPVSIYLRPKGLPYRTRYARMAYHFYNTILPREDGRFPKYSVSHSRNRREKLRRLLESGLLPRASADDSFPSSSSSAPRSS